MNTKNKFNDDPYCRQCTCEIIGINGKEVFFDQTCFYPESGGQPGDNGKYEDYEIINTRYDSKKSSIVHEFRDTTGLSVGDKGTCILNWETRYQNMKLHSALHILYLSFIDIYGPSRVRGANIGSNKGRLDLEYFEEIDSKQVTEKVNSIIELSCEISTFPDKNKKDFRYWEIANYPPIPCGGTHVKNTKEIGAIECKVKSKGKQGKRIYISFQE